MLAENNICRFKGYFLRDPELGDMPNGDVKVINFQLAVKHTVKRGDEFREETSFPEFEAFHTGAERIAADFRKGDRIEVDCIYRTNNYEKDGQKRTRHKFRVLHFEKLESGRRNPE